MKYNYPKNNFLIIIISLFLMSGGLLPTKAFCQLSAEAEIDYVNYDVRDNTGQHVSARSLSQRYSLLYETEGKIIDGRLGKYNLALGYDWATFDTTINSTAGTDNPQGSRGHILYRGEVAIDPKEMPLRFTAYSRDMTRNSFLQDDSSLVSTLLNKNPLMGNPQITTGIMDGIHSDSGATLVMGVKNGMTNGYNEILRHFPMLMLDYRDTINHDLQSTSPINDRLSRLAFVSLNKKDNWFHYRLITYNDYINPENNYKETQFQLGTVDQAMQRRWIDFTNWLSVSADGQLTKRTSGATASSSTAISSTSTQLTDSFTEFDLNLFGVAQRSSWEARSFNNFNRIREDNGRITYRTSAPLYANGTVSADTSWNTRFSYKNDRDNQSNNFEDINVGYRIDTFKRSTFTLSQQLDVEKATSNNTDMLITSGALETTSTARLSRILSFGASYNIRNYSYNNSTNFLDQMLRATATYTPSNQTRWVLSQITRLTNGTSQYINSSLLGATLTAPQYTSPRSYLSTGGPSVQSITGLSFFWSPLPRLNASVAINEDIYLPKNAPQSFQTNLIQSIDYSGANFKLTSRNTLSTDNTDQTTSVNAFNSYNRADYTFSRSLDAHGSITYNKAIGNSNESNALSCEQALNYYYYSTRGVARRLFEINELIDHVENSTSANMNYYSSITRNRYTDFSLGAKYYPLRQLLLAAGSKYTFFNNVDDHTLTYFGSIGLNYRLLQANVEYIYGTAKADGRIEKKLTANVKKTF